jgi:hypothetical protein
MINVVIINKMTINLRTLFVILVEDLNCMQV